MIRPAELSDIAAVLGVWNPVIRDTTVTFSSEEKTEAGLWETIGARRAGGQEFLVAEEGGEILGFVTWGQFRGGDGYIHAMEHTIILAPGARGRGIGRALIGAAEATARAAGAHILVAGISAENGPALAFHRAVGFEEAGRVREAGRKFGRWIDLVLMQKRL